VTQIHPDKVAGLVLPTSAPNAQRLDGVFVKTQFALSAARQLMQFQGAQAPVSGKATGE
jgi:hypothetical protein